MCRSGPIRSASRIRAGPHIVFGLYQRPRRRNQINRAAICRRHDVILNHKGKGRPNYPARRPQQTSNLGGTLANGV